jgi:hypothetical protein
MRRTDTRFAMAARDKGVRKIGRLTWRAGAVGAAGSALIAIAFGHNVAAHQQPGHSSRPGQSTIVIPAQPPAPAQGSGQVISGAS